MREKLLDMKKFLAFYVFVPIILDLVIESLNRKSLFSGVTYMFGKPFLFLFNVLIIMLTLSVAMFFQREVFVLSLISLVWLLFGIVNFVILHFRVTPFSAVDFTLISSAISVSGHYLSTLNIAMMILAILILVISVVCLFKMAPRFHRNATKKAYILSTGVMLTLACCIFVIRNSSTSVQALADNYTNIAEAYENYGFVYCFTNSILDTGISRPEGYSEETMRQLRDSLAGESTGPDKKPDIIMIQLESFFDVDNVTGLRFSRDPLPDFHRLQQEYTSGQLTVPTVGAGTVNTEFEVLTGMSQHDFGAGEYPYKTVLKSKASESICQDLRKLGYTSYAIHNNTGTFYGRNKVFANLGFDTFIPVEYMNGVTLNLNGWAKDDVVEEKILQILDEDRKDDGSARFIFAITVQGHGKYDGIEMRGEQPVEVYGAPAGREDAWRYYVNELYEVDQMIGGLLEQLEERDTPTILVLYGDHLPSLSLNDEDLKKGDLYETQYVIWDNYGLERKDQDLMAYQLYPEVLGQAGICEGMVARYHQQTDRDSESYLEGLRLLEYDLLYGEDYVYGGEAPFSASDLQMGDRRIPIVDVYRQAGQYMVRGKNFTPYCKIVFDGKELESEWVDENHILLKERPEPSERKRVKRAVYAPDELPDTFVIEVQNGDGVRLSFGGMLRWRDTSLAVRLPH